MPLDIGPAFGQGLRKLAMQLKDAEAQAVARQLGPKLLTTPPRVAAEPMPAQILADQTAEFARWVGRYAEPVGDLRLPGALRAKALNFLDLQASGAITVTDQ